MSTYLQIEFHDFLNFSWQSQSSLWCSTSYKELWQISQFDINSRKLSGKLVPSMYLRSQYENFDTLRWLFRLLELIEHRRRSDHYFYPRTDSNRPVEVCRISTWPSSCIIFGNTGRTAPPPRRLWIPNRRNRSLRIESCCVRRMIRDFPRGLAIGEFSFMYFCGKLGGLGNNDY